MKVIDTFLFSEAYEAELLLIKLILEDPVVDTFVLVESSQTFRGEEKGLQARKVVDNDPRFAPFLDKLVIVSHWGRLFDGPPCYDTFYQNEELSRASVGKFVDANFSDEDWVIISDVDEAVDCTNPGRKATFLAHLDEHKGTHRQLRFGHYRYWYDFDNRCYWTGIVTPVLQLGDIRSGHGYNARSRPKNEYDIPAGDSPLFFEYTFCFPAQDCWKKLCSFIHDKYTESDLEISLATNHWVKAPARGEYPGQNGEVDWLETVQLTEKNSPKYVRDNLARLKTNIIPKNYLENRQRWFGK